MRASSEKLCLQWNEFQENISSSFKELREDKDFTDVTLVCEDGKRIKAHKVVLASSSPIFVGLLKKNFHPHPLLYMRGLKSEDMIGVIDFLYCGETNIFQDNLDTFFALAQELRLKGLTAVAEVEKELPIETPQIKRIVPKKENVKKAQVSESNDVSSKDSYEFDTKASEAVSEALSNDKVSIDIQDLDEQVKSLITRGDISAGPGQGYMASCNVCGKQGPYKNMPNHVETNHITGIMHACNICGKISRTRTALSQHKSTNHKKRTKDSLNHHTGIGSYIGGLH